MAPFLSILLGEIGPESRMILSPRSTKQFHKVWGLKCRNLSPSPMASSSIKNLFNLLLKIQEKKGREQVKYLKCKVLSKALIYQHFLFPLAVQRVFIMNFPLCTLTHLTVFGIKGGRNCPLWSEKNLLRWERIAKIENAANLLVLTLTCNLAGIK